MHLGTSHGAMHNTSTAMQAKRAFMHPSNIPLHPSIPHSRGAARVLAMHQQQALRVAQVWAGGEQPADVHHVVAGDHQLHGATNKVAQPHAQKALVGPAAAG